MDRTISDGGRGAGGGHARTMVTVAVLVVLILVHALRLGSYLGGTLHRLYYSYFSDLAVPFGMYLLLGLSEDRLPFLRDWRWKAGIVFGAASSAEMLQALGVPLLGSTYDPLDLVMFGAGVALGVVVDRVLSPRKGSRRSQ